MSETGAQPGGCAVRGATADDVAALALIGAATFLDTFAGVLDGKGLVAHCARAHSEAAYASYFAQGAAAWLAETEAGGAPVGYALVAEPALPGAQAGDLELKRIYTLSRFHGAGLGKRLMAAAIDHARQRGAVRLLLGAYEGNGRALAFYARHGFTQIGTRSFDVGGVAYADKVLATTL